MSATAFPKGPPSHVIPLHSGSTLGVTSSDNYKPELENREYPRSDDSLPSLPHVSIELERYFAISRQIEAALSQQKHLAKRYGDELRELQIQYSKLASDSDQRIREYTLREERLKSQLNTQLMTYQQTEKILQSQVGELSRHLEKDREERRKSELEIELLKANLEYMKQREESLSNAIKTLQITEKTQAEKISHLARQNRNTETELNRYKAAWAQVSAMERKAKATLLENPSLKTTIEEMKIALETERRKNDGIDELIKKERREKRAALTCFHTSEAKLTQANWELENMRKRYEQNTTDDDFELKI